jgi:cytochrome b561
MAAHPPLIRALHWLTLAALLLAFGLALAREGLEGQVVRLWALDLHRGAGLLVWLLTCVRLAVRLRLPLADAHRSTSPAQRWASAAVHGLLYVLLVALPLLGWALTCARGQPVMLPFFGALPAWPDRDLDLADTLEVWHATAAWALAAVAGVHAAAALWHHRVLRDDVLVSMWPRLGRSGG